MTPRSTLPHEVLREIRRILRRVTEHSRALSRVAGLTVPQLLCLKALDDARDEAPSVGELGSRVHLSPATVSRIADRLEAAGLVARRRDERDRRTVRVELTEAGAQRCATLPTPLQERFVERLMALSAGDREQILATLQQVNRLMDAEDLDAAPILTPDSPSSPVHGDSPVHEEERDPTH